MLRGDDWWCQGYSEPGAGSDLANIKTTAVRDGDDYVINGQKTWTTLAQHANMMFVLVRTERSEKRQDGISFLPVDLNTPGVEVRPIITLDGDHEINEVFFTDVRTPASNLVAEENKGWTYAKYLLTYEALGAGVVAEPVLSVLMSGRALALANKPLRESVAGGDAIVAFAHEEPGSRWDLAHVETRATAMATGWSLTGVKAVVANAEAADRILVSARTAGEADDPKGVSVRGYRLIDGGRAAEVIPDGVALPADALVGARDGAFPVIEAAVGFGVLALCAEALGAMETLKSTTLDYLRTRVQFGTPIGTNQALQHRMANLLIDIEQARSAVIYAAAAMGRDRTERERTLAAAKYTIGATGAKVAEEAIQFHGGIGMTEELPATQFARRLMMIDHQLGDTDHHLQRFIDLGRAA
ncbi:acyl-CoA dehydrogenase family protein [Phenylobacterium sp.]|uniref:acyl-CoA dehydrogenase family protein n=1 Tax=Phenylobacterium sp. TaxID=1871053 RepID=UPI0025EBC635|nr:acyl-CoA dehydrogenase family protein [Phenylobacterium sp.]